MSPQKIIIPTVTEYNKKDFKAWVKELKPYFNSIHIDIIDESYGKPTWFDEIDGFKILANYKNIKVHLMVEDPIIYLENKVSLLKKENAVYLIPKSKIGVYKDLQDLAKLGYNLGIAYEPNDEAKPVPEIFNLAKEFMFMGIIPGGTGREMIIDIYEKLKNFNVKYRPKAFEIPISVDGGFNIKTSSKFLQSNVNIIYANSFFKEFGIKQAINKLKIL